LAALRDPSCQHCSQHALLRPCPGWVLAGIFCRPALECGRADCGEQDYGLDVLGGEMKRPFELRILLVVLACRFLLHDLTNRGMPGVPFESNDSRVTYSTMPF
jgi:hypothetical protein